MKLSTITLYFAILCFTTVSMCNAQAPQGEGPTAREFGQWGVNRRVVIQRPAASGGVFRGQIVGFNELHAVFDCSFVIPAEDAEDNALLPGELPNKPSYYFGARGPGRFWAVNPRDEDIDPSWDADRINERLDEDIDPSWDADDINEPLPTGWYESNQVEVDAGLEYDSRTDHRGWRAFISVNGRQADVNVGGGPWRGQAQQYLIRFNINDQGVPTLQVVGGGQNFTFAWVHNDTLDTPAIPGNDGDFVYRNRSVIELKKVIANTRPNGITDDLDGTRIVTTATNCHVGYIYDAVLNAADGQKSEQLDASYIQRTRTGYDTPGNAVDGGGGNDAVDCLRGRVASNRSRYKVDFRNLDYAQAISDRFPELFPVGRMRGSTDATQGSASRYTTETVRINLGTLESIRGIVHIINSPRRPRRR